MMKQSITIMLSVFVLLTGMAPFAHADDSAVIKSRMAQRLSEVVSLKQSGAVGENNQGYLTVRGNLSSAQSATVKAENNDRKAVYGIIASKTKSNIAAVGKTRAASIRKSAPKGTWLQLSSGHWQQK